ncbi:MAG: EamA family transporter [Flavobacteriaceae bacterium]|nr:MAG: EamA family transporter [Flavobacteriaceae bacterium]
MGNNYVKHLSELILATLFISTSGVLGKYIAMPSEVIVWFRSFFAFIFLFLFCKIRNIPLTISIKKDHIPLIISSVLMAGHWVTYFYALKLSNVALGMLSLFTFPVITALLEPLFLKTKRNPIHIIMSIIVLTGIYILAPDFNPDSSQVQGILFGLLSAVCYSIRVLILKQHVNNYHGSMLMYYQTFVITIVMTPFLFFMNWSGFQSQFPYLILIGIVTTAIGHSLMIYALKFFSATATTIISSIQPVFGIVFAFFFLDEIPQTNTYIGGLLILATAFTEGIRSTKK